MALTVRLRLNGVLRDQAGGHATVPVTLPDGATLHELFDVLADELPALERRIRDETRTVRRHINLFVDGQHVRDVSATALHDGAEVLVLPAVSGGAG